jgi:hypothetical protein
VKHGALDLQVVIKPVHFCICHTQEGSTVNFKSKKILFTLFTLVLTISGIAKAQDVPVACNTKTFNRNAYLAGFHSGQLLVSQAWDRINDCDKIETFDNIVISSVDSLTLPLNPSLYVTCRYTGIIDGVLQQLADMDGSCTNQCFADGTVIGQISAQAYCDLSIALGGLGDLFAFMRAPVQVCGFSFQLGCDSTFIGFAATYLNMGQACSIYTVSPFDIVFDNTRNFQCAYVPPVPPENP